MKRRIWSFFLIALALILGISSSLSCGETVTPNDGTEWDWHNCPAAFLVEDIAVRADDLLPGWLLSNVQTGPTCEYPFNIAYEAFAWLSFADDEPWGDPRRSISNELYLRWEEAAANYYFEQWAGWASGWQETDIPRADAALVRLKLEGQNATATGVYLLFRRGLYHVSISSYNQDLADLGVSEGEAVDEEVDLLVDVGTKVASRIP